MGPLQVIQKIGACFPQGRHRRSKKKGNQRTLETQASADGATTSSPFADAQQQDSGNGRPSAQGTGQPATNGDAAGSSRPSLHMKSPSVMSELEWHECREDFSLSEVSGGTSSAARSPVGGEVRASNGASMSGREPADDVDSDEMHSGESETSEEALAAQNKLGCLSMLDSMLSAPDPVLRNMSSRNGVGRSQRRSGGSSSKPEAGCSLSKRDMGMSSMDVQECWEPCDGTDFRIRGVDYMRSKQKVHSEKAIYNLVAVDMFSFETKTFHVAKMMGRLPPAPTARHSAGGGLHLPPLIIMNLQLPTYNASFFGTSDGPGHSIVQYFALAEDFDPATVNPKALGLLQRYVSNGREADGTSTRDRMKLIPRVVNVEEWSKKAPLSSAEYKLLINYNEKPILTRPQQAFFNGPNYLEVDFDVHMYAFLARKALSAYLSRLKTVVWENAFVIQGNAPGELPEVVLGAARLYRTDFEQHRPFTEFCKRPSYVGGDSLVSQVSLRTPTPASTPEGRELSATDATAAVAPAAAASPPAAEEAATAAKG